MTVRRQLAILAGLLLLLGAWDFARRVYVGRDASLRAFQAPQLSPLPGELGVEAVRREMLGWLPGAAGAAPAGTSGSVPVTLLLRGVFARRGLVIAVLEASSAGGGPPERIRAIEGDVVHGWTVTDIEPRSVTLRRDDGMLQLPLFRPDAPGATASGPRVE